jgi:hypothetical protein
MELCGDIVADMATPIGPSAVNQAQSQSATARRLLPAFVLLIAALVIRWPVLGDPNYHIDEGFYLLVGERMHDGMLPYVDLWDRKPLGLFALYWAITAFGDVYAYQIAAIIAVWLTGWIICHIIMRRYSALAGILGGIVYVATLGALAGGGGQSPVFYNLPMALAGLLTLKCLDETDLKKLLRKGLCAMLLSGLAMTIKQTTVVEGAFFGIVLLACAWHISGAKALWQTGPILALTALVPTALCFGFYALLGHGAAYYDATVTSIFYTSPATAADEAERIAWLIPILLPLAITALVGIAFSLVDPKQGPKRDSYFAAGWVVAAILGFFAVPNYYDHYALPLATSLAVASGRLFTIRYIGSAAALFATGWLLLVSGFPQSARTNYSIDGANRANTLIRAHLGTGCLFAYDAPAFLYRITDSCLPTSRAFSEHLSNAREAAAIGLDPVVETRRLLAAKPSVIAIAAKPTLKTPNRETQYLVRSALRAEYQLVGKVDLVDVVSLKPVEIWARR